MRIGVAVLAIIMILVSIVALVMPGSDGRVGLTCLGIIIVLYCIMSFMLNKLKRKDFDEYIDEEEQEENQL